MAEDREAKRSFTVSVAKKKVSGIIVLARHESNVEMGNLSETLRRAVSFAWWAGCSLQGGSHIAGLFCSSG